MNGSTTPLPLPPPIRWLRPAWFFAGLALGGVALAWAGHRAAMTDFHPGFVRFSLADSPESSYYPTVDEMCSIVRAQCRPDQVLVIVGGNSILQGVWQPVSDVWTRHLQEDVGGRFCVVNLAFRGAAPTDGAAVVAEVLRNEFPRQVYIANEAPLTSVDCFGSDTYRFVFWQAYFSGRLIDVPIRDQRIGEFLRNPANRRATRETAISVLFNRPLHYHDLWNDLAFNYFNTVPSLFAPSFPQLLTPHCDYPDTEPDATDPAFREKRYSPDANGIEMQIVRGYVDPFYRRGPGGAWELDDARRADMERTLREAFPPVLKPRTLMLISRSSPYYSRQLTTDEQACQDQAFRDTVDIWEKAGYNALEYGRDYTDDDFGDRTHLSKLGGRKLAATVAPEVVAIAQRLGYLP